MDLSVWGTGFLKALEGQGDASELMAGLAVCSIARESLAHAAVATVSLSRAMRILKPISNLEVRSWAANALQQCRKGRSWPGCIVAILTEFGRSLERRGVYGAAADVFTVVGESPFVEPTTRLFAMRHRAFNLRSASRLFDAEMCYIELGERARAWGNLYYELAARRGVAAVAAQRGHFAEAEAILVDLLRAAERGAEGKMVVEVLIDLSSVAGNRLEYALSIQYGMRAAHLAEDDTDLHCAIQNVAEACERMGARDTAAKISDWLLSRAPGQRERIEAADLRDRIEEATVEPVTQSDVVRLRPLTDALDALDAAGSAR